MNQFVWVCVELSFDAYGNKAKLFFTGTNGTNKLNKEQKNLVK